MRRILLIGLLLVAGAAFVALSTGAKEEDTLGKFKVELDNAFGLVEGGDFKVAGVTAGKITTLDVDKETKRAINQSLEAQGMLQALEAALGIDLLIEGEGSPDKQQFMDIARRDGLRAALVWRDGRFDTRAS